MAEKQTDESKHELIRNFIKSKGNILMIYLIFQKFMM